MAATVGDEMLLHEVNVNGEYEIYKQKAVHKIAITILHDLTPEDKI